MNFISMSDFTTEQIFSVLDSALDLKEKKKRGKVFEPLEGKSLGMLFEKSSTRTRVSFEVAMTDLGGHALYLNWKDLQLERGESLEDTARVLSSYVDGIMIRAYKHESVCKLAEFATVPVINALSDLEHPCQSLADLMTIREKKGNFAGLKFGWIGDGNNVCNSSILACVLTGMRITVACPEGHEPDSAIISKAIDLGCEVEIVNDPEKAAEEADVLYTDVWVSMGDEGEKEERLKVFKPFQINRDLMQKANSDVVIMHCLPAHRGEEITDDIMSDSHSVIFDQAENRLHAQKALLSKLMG
ncbi:MAG: ornithine carbamoyltransferase [Halobacteriota archaeon]|nr:ornithine carbamoyltransferase [Halobacteriota archaeon]